MAYNTVQDDDYIESKKKAIEKNIEVLTNGLNRFEKVLCKLTEAGITRGTTYEAINVYSGEVRRIYNKISGDSGIDYKATVPLQADHFVDEVKTAGGFLYD
jgi:hypothetical protein